MSRTTRSRVHLPTLLSLAVAWLLIAVGAVRALSYVRGGPLAPLGELVRESWLGWLAYRPHVAADVRYFKILATPSVVAAQYLVFRWLNRGHRRGFLDEEELRRRRLDFGSPWLRLALTSLVSAHWLVLELFKFGSDDFYPSSPLEDPRINLAVLIAGQVLAFRGMKHLSFEPLLVEPRPPAPGGDGRLGYPAAHGGERP